MKVKQIFPLNPLSWLIKWNLTQINPLKKSVKIPKINYEREYWIKHPEKTLVERKGNCINQSILIYYNFFYKFNKEDMPLGVFYFKQSEGMHAECGFIDEENSAVAFLSIGGKVRKIVKKNRYQFITKKRIEEVLL